MTADEAIAFGRSLVADTTTRLARDYSIPWRSGQCLGCFDAQNIAFPTHTGRPRRCSTCPLKGTDR